MPIAYKQLDEDFVILRDKIDTLLGVEFEKSKFKLPEKTVNHFNGLLSCLTQSLANLVFNIKEQAKNKERGDEYQEDYLKALPEMLREIIKLKEHEEESLRLRQIAIKITKDFGGDIIFSEGKF